jgi:hypothetical protein
MYDRCVYKITGKLIHDDIDPSHLRKRAEQIVEQLLPAHNIPKEFSITKYHSRTEKPILTMRNGIDSRETDTISWCWKITIGSHISRKITFCQNNKILYKNVDYLHGLKRSIDGFIIEFSIPNHVAAKEPWKQLKSNPLFEPKLLSYICIFLFGSN